jgi:hypothetical protein
MASYQHAGSVRTGAGSSRRTASRAPRAWTGRASLRLRRATRDAYRWLRADGHAVYLELARSHRAAPYGGSDLRDGLRAWASMIHRRRALVVVRRHVIAGLAVTTLAVAVSILAGGDRRSLWLAAPVVLALADAALLASRTVSVERVAQLLDQRLGLHDRLITALGILREQESQGGLRALVVAEAQTAVDASFASVRLRTRRPAREWAALCAGVAVLAALAAVPGIGGANTARRRASRDSRSQSAAAARKAAAANGASSLARREQAAGTQGTQINRPPLAVTSNGSATQTGSGFSPYGHGGVSFSAKQLAKAGIASPSAATKALGSLAVSEAGGAGSAGGASTPGTGAGPGAAKPAAGSASGATPTTSAGGSASGAGSLTPLSGRRGTNALAGAGTGKANASAGAGGSGNSPPGGNAAGSASGSTALRAGLVPVLGTGSSSLPLQAGYAPSGARQTAGGEGISQTPNGGGSGGRSAQAAGGGQTSVSSSLGLIPPTFNSTSALDQGVLSSYFGSANQLTPGNW